MGFFLSLFMASLNAPLKLVEKTKEYLVSDINQLKDQLEGLGVDLKEVIDISTKKPVKSWDNIMGVFKKEGKIYAYPRSINSEIEANLKMFS